MMMRGSRNCPMLISILERVVSRSSVRPRGLLSFSTHSVAASSSSSKPTTTTYWCPLVAWPDRLAQGSLDLSSEGVLLKVWPDEDWASAQARTTAGAASHALMSLQHEDASKRVCLSPGLIDVHVHISALGRDWEGYQTATRAAAAGGITTILSMPLNSLPPTTTLEAVQAEYDEAHKAGLCVNVGLWGGLVPSNCGNAAALREFLSDPRVLGLKAFLAPLPEAAGYQAVRPSQLLEAARICGPLGKPILVHSELMTPRELVEQTSKAYRNPHASLYQTHLNSRPAEWEQEAVKIVLEAAEYCDMHIVHLSDSLGCLPLIRDWRQQQQQEESNKSKQHTLTVETCPHYLAFSAETIPPDDVRFKCFPPIRSQAHQQGLWEGLESGEIDMIASDHSPCTPNLRHDSSYRDAWGGLTGLQYQIPATWTTMVQRGLTPLDLSRWWSAAPAQLARLSNRGSFLVGHVADFVWWDTETVQKPADYSKEYHRHTGDSVYADRPLQGQVLGTWVAGQQVYDGLTDQHVDTTAGIMLQQAH